MVILLVLIHTDVLPKKSTKLYMVFFVTLQFPEMCVIRSYTVEPPIKDTPNKGNLSIKDKSTRPNS